MASRIPTAPAAFPNTRPVTSKARGTCKYYNTRYGCYAGNQCKFLHGSTERLTPYDKSKVCKFYAAGYCKNGDKCWFIHADAAGRPESEDDLCSICYDKPVTYGLLVGCSHMFCLSCIKNWRDSEGKSADIVDAGTTKTCPMCRTSSRYVTPSSIFYPEGDPKKLEVIEKYKVSMSRVDCKYFDESNPRKSCPFGDDCFYKHEVNGKPYIFHYRAGDRAERRRDLWQFEDFDTTGLDSLNEDSFEAVFNAINRLVGTGHFRLQDMPRFVMSSVAAILGASNAGPLYRLDEDPAEEVSPSDRDASSTEQSSPDVGQTTRQLSDEIVVIPPDSPSADLSSLPGYSPQEVAFTLNPASPEFIPAFLDNLRPLHPGPSSYSVSESAATDDSVLDPALLWSVPPSPVPSVVAEASEAAIGTDAIAQDPEPPFMTDGRGRVVWSSMTASSRAREGRRPRATSSSGAVLPHTKSNIEFSATEESSDEASQHESLGTRSPSASRRLVRRRSLPLVGTSDTPFSAEFVTDGRGRVVFASGRH